MAITRDKKLALVAKMTDMFTSSKATAFAQYQGLSVAEIQELRRSARTAGVTIIVVKNRLVRVAMGQVKAFKDTETSALTGQLLYAVSDQDETAPAQVLHNFAKTHPALQLMGGFSADGSVMTSADVTALANLPSKDQLIAQVVAQLLSPVNDVTNGLSGNLHALLDGVKAKAV